MARTHDPEGIVFVLKKGSACRHSLSWYLTAEANHIRWHQQILVRQTQREYLSDVEQLRGTVDAFCRFVEDLPAAAHAERTREPRAVLGYLTFWHERYVGQIEAQLAGQSFAGPHERLKDLNTQAATTTSSVPVDELVRRFQAADARLRDFGQTLDPQQILVEVQGYLYSLDGAIERIATHIRNQHQKFERELKRRKLP